MAFDLLPALRPREWRSVICVRVCRKWEYRGGTDDGPVQHVDLVLVDEKGNSMYGEILAHEVETKSNLLEEGSIYVIIRFRVSNAKSGYRPVDSCYMVEFTLHTIISPAKTVMPDFPKYAYKITPIGDLSSHAGDIRNFLDTIGVLVEKSEAYTVHLPNKPAPTLTRNIILRDLSYSEMKVTLWGERAASFTTDGLNGATEDKPIVVLFVGGLVKSYQGTYYLSANTASRWYFNPPIPETRQFYASLQNQRIQVRSVPAPVQQQGQLQVAMPLEEKTLRELNDKDPYDFAEHGYRCTVTIGRLVPNVSWWFPSCTRCSKSCVVDGSGYRCNGCSATSFKFKYKLCFVALDGTDEAEMICFGDIARRIIGKPVQQVLRTATAANTYPPDITKLVSLRFTFQITLTQQSYYREHKTYQVVSVVTSYGHQHAVPHALGDGDGDHPDGPQLDRTISAAANDETGQASPTSVTDHHIASPLATSSPPPPLHIDDTPTVKNQTNDGSEKYRHSTARKRLNLGADSAEEETLAGKNSHEKDSAAGSLDGSSVGAADRSTMADKTRGADKKRSRGASSLNQQSG